MYAGRARCSFENRARAATLCHARENQHRHGCLEAKESKHEGTCGQEHEAPCQLKGHICPGHSRTRWSVGFGFGDISAVLILSPVVLPRAPTLLSGMHAAMMITWISSASWCSGITLRSSFQPSNSALQPPHSSQQAQFWPHLPLRLGSARHIVVCIRSTHAGAQPQVQ